MADKKVEYLRIGAQRRETAALVEVLKEGTPGDVYDDEQAADLIDMPVNSSTEAGRRGYSYLASAIRRTLKEHGVHWERVWGEKQIRCQDAEGRLRSVRHRRRKATMQFKYGGYILNGLNVRELPEEKQAEARVEFAQTRALMSLASGKATKMLLAREVETPAQLPRLVDAFDAFKKLAADAKEEKEAEQPKRDPGRRRHWN